MIESNMLSISFDKVNVATLRLSCAMAMLSIIEADAHERSELGMSSDVIGEALHGIGLLVGDAINSLSGASHE